MATAVSLRGESIRTPYQGASISPALKKVLDTTVKILKVASSAFLTFLAYAAVIAACAGIATAAGAIALFVPSSANVIIASLTTALGGVTVTSIGSPFKLYNKIYKWLYNPSENQQTVDLSNHQIRLIIKPKD